MVRKDKYILRQKIHRIITYQILIIKLVQILMRKDLETVIKKLNKRYKKDKRNQIKMYIKIILF